MLNALKPYWSIIKAGLLLTGVLTVFSLGSWAGCSAGKRSSEARIAALTKDKDVLAAQNSAITEAVNQANKQVEANKRFAKEREEMAEKAAKDAAKAKKELAAKQKDFERRLKAAEKDPDCKAILEQRLCPLLRNY